jgi:multicomponent Na+:H+ antiporter subunit E
MRLRFALLVVWSAAVWCALWGDLSVANLLAGAVLGAGVGVVVGIGRAAGGWRLAPWGAVVGVAMFVRELVKANLIVARQVLTMPTSAFRSAVIAYRPEVPLPRALMVLLADAITLTPGTMTLEIDEAAGVLYVHALHIGDGVDGDEAARAAAVDGVIDGIRVLERAIRRGLVPRVEVTS